MKKVLLVLAITSFFYVNASNENVVETLNSVVELPTELEEDMDDCYPLKLSCYSTMFCENGHSNEEVAEVIVELEADCHK